MGLISCARFAITKTVPSHKNTSSTSPFPSHSKTMKFLYFTSFLPLLANSAEVSDISSPCTETGRTSISFSYDSEITLGGLTVGTCHQDDDDFSDHVTVT